MRKRTQFNTLSNEELIVRISRWLFDGVLILTFTVFLVHMIGYQIVMDGNSMQPTVEAGDVLLVSRFSGKLIPLKRYDIVVYQTDSGSKTYLKRVAALPGETVQISNGKLMINGKVVDDNGLFSDLNSAGLAAEPLTLADDEYFVLGEMTDASLDSRFSDVGNLKIDNILGKVWFRSAPFIKFGVVR